MVRSSSFLGSSSSVLLQSSTCAHAHGTNSVTRTTYYVSDADVARRLDAADGVMDGRFKGAEIHTSAPRATPPLPQVTSTTRSTYLVGDKDLARRLDAADGVMDGKYKGVEIRSVTRRLGAFFSSRPLSSSTPDWALKQY